MSEKEYPVVVVVVPWVLSPFLVVPPAEINYSAVLRLPDNKRDFDGRKS